ncbi:MAG TPA: translocation/assembly module TamB domain-containing protein, partial [Burkholderiaceae bacterium]
ALQKALGRALTPEFSASLQGSLSAAPSLAQPLQWQASAGTLRLSERGRGALLSVTDWGLALNADAGLSQGVTAAELKPGHAEVMGAGLSWTRMNWAAARHGDEGPQFSGEAQLDPLAVAPLLARWQPGFGWGGDLLVEGRFKAKSATGAAAKGGIELEAFVQRASGDLSVTDERGPQKLGLTGALLGLQVKDGQWHFTQALAGAVLGNFGASVTLHAPSALDWPRADSRLEGLVHAQVGDVGVWGAWVPPGWRIGGALIGQFSVAGTLAEPQMHGAAEGQRLVARNPLLGVDVRELAFRLVLAGREARLESFKARAAEGTLQASGSASLGEKAQADLKLHAENFALLNRVDRRLRVSGDAALHLEQEALALDGAFKIDAGLFDLSRADAPSLDSDVLVLRADAPREPAPPPGPPRRIHVKLALDLGEKLRLRGYGLQTHLEGKLTLTQEQGQTTPRLNGIVQAVDGTYNAYGQKLEIERGELRFVGPYDNPRLDMLALRPNLDVRVGVRVGGTAYGPRIQLYSEPEMSEVDKLSWLLMGRASEGLGHADTALLQRAALALLSGEGESTSGRLLKNLGLDELSVAQNDDDARGTVVRLGKQISRRWYVGYERSLNATTGSWQLIYRIAQRFTLRAQSGDDNALDLIWTWKWN